MDTILVVNAGSSSVKFRVFETAPGKPLKQLVSGQIDGIGVRPKLRATGAKGEDLIDRRYDAKEVPDVEAALAGARSPGEIEQLIAVVERKNEKLGPRRARCGLAMQARQRNIAIGTRNARRVGEVVVKLHAGRHRGRAPMP